MYQTKVDISDLKGVLLKPRHLLLLETSNNQFVGLRVTRTHLTYVNYDFISQISTFNALTAVGTTGSFVQHVTMSITSLSGVSDWLAMATNQTNNLYQVFYGIKPSYLYATLEYPAGQPTAQLSQTALYPQSAYPYIFDHSGYSSPYFKPSPETEFISLSNIKVQFTLANSVSISIRPEMLFVVNNCITEPITDMALLKQMVQRKVPVEIIDLGQIYNNVAFPSTLYGAKPLSVSAITGD
jgi:hypothetical protein